ncbi:hypothetical protein QQP08_025783 [Theobroma cacao]|nr:hypothetical protein QQP08_025783 [Theobroma cacao]
MLIVKQHDGNSVGIPVMALSLSNRWKTKEQLFLNPYAVDQVTSTIPTFLSRPRAVHTASDPSTMLFLQGGWYACSSSHPRIESHSSTTLAVTLLPLLAVIVIIFPHLDPPAYHPVDNATTRSELL